MSNKKKNQSNKFKIIACGLGASTLAETLLRRFPKHIEIHSQIITADCDSNNFSKEVKIPNTNRGSGKSAYDGRKDILPQARKFLQNNSTISKITNSNVIVMVALGGGSGNAIKGYICNVLTKPKKQNKVIFIPILPMIQEGVAASVNTSYGFHDILELISGKQRKMTVIPFNLESARQYINDTNIHVIARRLETLFMTTILFKNHYITDEVKSTFTIDAAEYESILLGTSNTVRQGQRGTFTTYATRGYGLFTYMIMDFVDPEEDEGFQIPNFDTVIPGLKPEQALGSATDISITIALSTFSNEQKVKRAERVLMEIQNKVHQINNNARIVYGLSVSPTARDHIYIASTGTTIDCITNFFYKLSDKAYQDRTIKISQTAVSTKKALIKYRENPMEKI